MVSCNEISNCGDCTWRYCAWCESSSVCAEIGSDGTSSCGSSPIISTYDCPDIDSYWYDYAWVWWTVGSCLLIMVLLGCGICICVKASQKKQRAAALNDRPLPVPPGNQNTVLTGRMPAQPVQPVMAAYPPVIYGPPPPMQPGMYAPMPVGGLAPPNMVPPSNNLTQQPPPLNFSLMSSEIPPPAPMSAESMFPAVNLTESTAPELPEIMSPKSPKTMRTEMTPEAVEQLKKNLQEEKKLRAQLQDRVQWLQLVGDKSPNAGDAVVPVKDNGDDAAAPQ